MFSFSIVGDLQGCWGPRREPCHLLHQCCPPCPRHLASRHQVLLRPKLSCWEYCSYSQRQPNWGHHTVEGALQPIRIQVPRGCSYRLHHEEQRWYHNVPLEWSQLTREKHKKYNKYQLCLLKEINILIFNILCFYFLVFTEKIAHQAHMMESWTDASGEYKKLDSANINTTEVCQCLGRFNWSLHKLWKKLANIFKPQRLKESYSNLDQIIFVCLHIWSGAATGFHPGRGGTRFLGK